MCAPGYSLSQGTCTKTINQTVNENCATQNSKGKCVTCRQFYKLKNGNCVPTG